MLILIDIPMWSNVILCDLDISHVPYFDPLLLLSHFREPLQKVLADAQNGIFEPSRLSMTVLAALEHWRSGYALTHCYTLC